MPLILNLQKVIMGTLTAREKLLYLNALKFQVDRHQLRAKREEIKNSKLKIKNCRMCCGMLIDFKGLEGKVGGIQNVKCKIRGERRMPRAIIKQIPRPALQGFGMTNREIFDTGAGRTAGFVALGRKVCGVHEL